MMSRRHKNNLLQKYPSISRVIVLDYFRKSGGTFDKVVVRDGGFQLKRFAVYFKSLLEVLWKDKK